MRRVLVTWTLVAAIALSPTPGLAWGFAGHRLVMRKAIDLLPGELKPLFDHFKEEVVTRSVDPDLWRQVGWDEDPNHFLDFGVPEYGEFPFAALPRDYAAALEKFGSATLKRNGLVPWRAAEEFGNLRRAFEGFKRRAPYAPTDVILFSSVAAHYIQDSHQPFHATDNHDGQLTGNHGIHARFERDLIERYQGRLRLAPAPAQPVTSARDATFDALLTGYRLVPSILQADREAVAGKDSYDDDYFEKFFGKVQPILEQRLSESITATAAVIIGAWVQAGRPVVSTQERRPIQRVRPAR
jgi:hypothetical protein